ASRCRPGCNVAIWCRRPKCRRLRARQFWSRLSSGAAPGCVVLVPVVWSRRVRNDGGQASARTGQSTGLGTSHDTGRCAEYGGPPGRSVAMMTNEVSAMPAYPESHRDLLDAPVAMLATQSANGYPQVTALWFLYEDGEIKLSLNTARQKVKNL